QCRRETMGEKWRHAPDGTGLSLDVEQRNVALGRRIELDDAGNAKARLEFVPHVGPQPVAAAQPEPMRGLVWVSLGIDEIAAELADVLKDRAIPAPHIVPELARGK